MALRSQRSKLVLKDLGNPDEIKSQPDTIRRLVLGTLVGIADGFIERTNPKDGEIMEGLIGQFRSIPAKEDGEELESGILFIPDAFHNLIAATLRGEKNKDPAAKVNFAFEVAAVRANNPQGRSWDFKPLIESETENPLDAFVGGIGKLAIKDGRRQLLIEGPKTQASAETGPKVVSGGKK
jgi:hypothetical protein